MKTAVAVHLQRTAADVFEKTAAIHRERGVAGLGRTKPIFTTGTPGPTFGAAASMGSFGGSSSTRWVTKGL